MHPEAIMQTTVSAVTLLSIFGGFIISIYNSNKNRILGDERRKQENVEVKKSINELSEEVTATNKRLEEKIDSVAEKVEEHAHFEARIACLEGKVSGLESLVKVLHP